MRQMIADACDIAGYPNATARHWAEAPAGGPAVWDVPTLEPSWPAELAHRAAVGPVVALLGFADRMLVSQARACGATACVDLPFEDGRSLSTSLDRVTAPEPRSPHAVPPGPASWRRHPPPWAIADVSRSI